MASGTPDYFQTVRITYGAAQRTYGLVTAVASGEKTVVSKSGKGVIYGGIGYLDHTASQKTSHFRLIIDDQVITTWTFEDMRNFGLVKENCNPLYLLNYDEVNFMYSVGISKGQTFERSVVLEYREAVGETPQVAGHLVFATI